MRAATPGGVAPDSAEIEAWSAAQLTELLALISKFDDEASARRLGVQRVAEALSAEAAALVSDGSVVAAVGFDPGDAPAAELAAVAAGARRALELPKLGNCPALSVALEDDRPLSLVVARSGDAGFSEQEVDLLHSMARVLGLGLRTLHLLDNERALREQRERQARENARLISTLRERQSLLERLSSLQRLIVRPAPLRETLEGIAEAARDLLGDDFAALRLIDPDDRSRTTLVATVNSNEELLDLHRRAEIGEGLGGRAMGERRLLTVERLDERSASVDFAARDVAAAMASPVFEVGEVAGSLAIGARGAGRVYGLGDQQVLLALAEHATLALNHAKALDDVKHQALHDSVTALPNRALFLNRLEHALARARRSSLRVGVLFVDLDGFKTVNDSLGHAAGDSLLEAVARRLAGRLRPSDTVARFGGDEFAILLDDVRDPTSAASAAARVLEAFDAPFELGEREVFVTASVGIAVGGADADDLLRNADLAMYRAKSQGKGRYEIYEPAMHAAIVERLELEVDLKRAIGRQELELHYQPIFNLRSGDIVALEALVRWRHPARGLVMPAEFVPLAEETGQILALGRWVLGEATRRAAAWRGLPGHERLQVSVNLSGAQLKAPQILDDVRTALAAAALDASALMLEVTETVLTEDAAVSVATLRELRAHGVRLAMDDFGTGYSSLQYLSRFPIDTLKVAKVFIDELGGSAPQPALTRAIVELAHIFDLRVIGEGIEKPDQSHALLELGCELGQGHCFSVALPPDETERLLAGSPGIDAARAPGVEAAGSDGAD